ncbi:MAG: hypothetical protein IPJ76_15540 [Flavobacteriales bacterium]|nr:MAG: hypothetical protein IPJ76_15540 [Flavobacteriales bacterium]
MSREVVLVCEDALGMAVLRRLISHARPQLVVRLPIVTGSNTTLFTNLPKYVRASQQGVAHIVLTDLDRNDCAPSLIERLAVPSIPGQMIFRVAVREVESWLLADRSGMAGMIGLPVAKLPMEPDLIEDPKQYLLNLVRKCKKTRLKRDVLPELGSSASKGVFYNDRFGSFARTEWNVDAAAKHSQSLNRTLLRLGTF